MLIDSDSWALKEFSHIDLGDQRLNKRLIKLGDASRMINYT